MPSSQLHYLDWLSISLFIIGLTECATLKKKLCVVQNGTADCSHMSLSEIPQNLPHNISRLDMSHNRLVRIAPEWLSSYPELVHLDAGFNSVSKLDQRLCQMLPLLRSLNMEKNQLYEPKGEDLRSCTNLVWLNMACNKLTLKGEPFISLQNLIYLDISNNNLESAQLSLTPQLPSLTHLAIGHNNIHALKADDFNFLSQASLRVLNMSSIPLASVEQGSFKNILTIEKLIFDGSKIRSSVLPEIYSELSGSKIEFLSLKKINMVTIEKTTFEGLYGTNLSILDLTGNGLSKIEPGSFLWLPKLQSLNMADNQIKQLKKDTFEGLRSLKMLNLTRALVNAKHDSLPTIEDFAFRHLSAVETLILHESAIRETAEHTFSGLTSLTDLDLSWTKYSSTRIITNLTYASLLKSPLRKLNLLGTAIKELDAGAFAALTHLSTLHLEQNFITQTITGDELLGLAHLEELYMFKNSLITLTPTSFIHVPNLQKLLLANSLRETNLDMEPSPFKPLTKLTTLDLSNNNIANIRETLLEGLDNLKGLYLQHNNLARLWKNTNVGGPVLFLKGAPNLEKLQLDSNGFDEIPEKGLKGLVNLTSLSLSSNLINSLKESNFEDLISLKELELRKNQITAVRQKVFQIPMTNLNLLVMDKNPFDCTCESIRWFLTWLNSTKAIVPDLGKEYICNTPLSYYNHSIMEFDVLSCKDMTPFQALYLFSSTAVLLLMFTALVVRFQGWRIQFYWKILISRTLGLSDATAEEGQAFDFDAYVIHAEKDKHWVERRILPLEEKQCNFCFEARDSIAGTSLLESIVSNMNKSRKILFVVTNNLLQDPWCRRFTAYHALHEVIEASRDAVVLIFLEDIHDYRLSRALLLRRSMLRPCCVLYWPPQKERIPEFHQNLLIALGKTNNYQQ